MWDASEDPTTREPKNSVNVSAAVETAADGDQTRT
jgi:hypothetical protein